MENDLIKENTPPNTATKDDITGLAAMFKYESVTDIILYHAGIEKGINHRRLDLRFSIHNRAQVHQTGELLATLKSMIEKGMIVQRGPNNNYLKGPNWKEPQFQRDNKYDLK
ncbi:hypothetical protein [Pectobacterium versatile]|uniref:hypothetical protein n=1 Tax=Pectobacterium versatile TaxID=2488639 RepID=UPI0030174441